MITDAELVNSNYRAYQPYYALGERGHHMKASLPGGPRFIYQDVVRSDVVHIHRFADQEIVELVRALVAQSIGVVWDNDDDLTAIPKTNPLYSKLGGVRSTQARARARQMLRLVHVATTPSHVLAERFAANGAQCVRVVENHVPQRFTDVRVPRHDGVVIGWLAGLEHQADYQALRLKAILQEILEQHPDVRIVSIGLGFGLDRERYTHHSLVPFRDLAVHLAQFDIGIAPLEDTTFNRARSNIKVKEYAAAGVPWLASPVGGYVGLGEKQGGRLVADDGWGEALDRMIVQARERRRLAKRARGWARNETIDKNVHQWEAVYREAIDLARSRGTAAFAAAPA